MTEPLLSFTDRGIRCAAGDFFIDPWRPVDRALVTHGHADHARPGHGRYMATGAAAPVMRHRLGDIALQPVPYGERVAIGDVTVSFHPAGHVPGSAQIRVERGGEGPEAPAVAPADASRGVVLTLTDVTARRNRITRGKAGITVRARDDGGRVAEAFDDLSDAGVRGEGTDVDDVDDATRQRLRDLGYAE